MCYLTLIFVLQRADVGGISRGLILVSHKVKITRIHVYYWFICGVDSFKNSWSLRKRLETKSSKKEVYFINSFNDLNKKFII